MCDEPERENEQPRPGLTNRGRWISAARTPAPDVPPAAPERPAAALIPLFRSNAVVWTTDITKLPRDQVSGRLLFKIRTCGKGRSAGGAYDLVRGEPAPGLEPGTARLQGGCNPPHPAPTSNSSYSTAPTRCLNPTGCLHIASRTMSRPMAPSVSIRHEARRVPGTRRADTADSSCGYERRGGASWSARRCLHCRVDSVAGRHPRRGGTCLQSLAR